MKSAFPSSLRILFVATAFAVSIFGLSVRDSAAQTMYVTDFAGVSLHGKSFNVPVNHGFHFKTYVDPNDPGTFTWTISGSYEITAGSLNSDTVSVRWATPGSYSVSVVYVGGGNTLSSSTSVIVSGNMTELTSQKCADEPTLTTVTAQNPAFIDFVNATGQTVKLYWINYSGQRTLFATLLPGYGSRYQMWLTFPWVVTE